MLFLDTEDTLNQFHYGADKRRHLDLKIQFTVIAYRKTQVVKLLNQIFFGLSWCMNLLSNTKVMMVRYFLSLIVFLALSDLFEKSNLSQFD